MLDVLFNRSPPFFFIYSYFFVLYVWMFCLHGCLCTVCTQPLATTRIGPKTPLELELQIICQPLCGFWESNPGLLVKQSSALNHYTISPALHFSGFFTEAETQRFHPLARQQAPYSPVRLLSTRATHSSTSGVYMYAKDLNPGPCGCTTLYHQPSPQALHHTP